MRQLVHEIADDAKGRRLQRVAHERMIGGERAVDQVFVEQADPERFVAEHLLSGEFVQPVDLALRDGGDRFRKAAVDDRGDVDMALFAELGGWPRSIPA